MFFSLFISARDISLSWLATNFDDLGYSVLRTSHKFEFELEKVGELCVLRYTPTSRTDKFLFCVCIACRDIDAFSATRYITI